jgi:hypothetical protein
VAPAPTKITRSTLPRAEPGSRVVTGRVGGGVVVSGAAPGSTGYSWMRTVAALTFDAGKSNSPAFTPRTKSAHSSLVYM